MHLRLKEGAHRPWLAKTLYGLKTMLKESLIALNENVNVTCKNVELDELETKPPAHYTSHSVIYMETAGKLVRMKFKERHEKGIGTRLHEREL